MIDNKTQKVAEVTESLFYALKNSGIPASEVIQKEKYTDVIYIVHGTTMIARSQSGIMNYYIVDINN